MALSPASADFERLLEPVPGAAPAGVSLRYEGAYDRIREARREDDASLPQGVWTAKLKTPDWRAVATIAAEAMGLPSKDLQLAVWLTQAWSHVDALGGAESGVSFVTVPVA